LSTNYKYLNDVTSNLINYLLQCFKQTKNWQAKLQP
jgi:hypothetical protein